MVIGRIQWFLSMCCCCLRLLLCVYVFFCLDTFLIKCFTLARCFMECQVLAEFVRILKISRTTKIEAPLLQYLSIMIQNMENEHAICKMQIPLLFVVNILYLLLFSGPLWCYLLVLEEGIVEAGTKSPTLWKLWNYFVQNVFHLKFFFLFIMLIQFLSCRLLFK